MGAKISLQSSASWKRINQLKDDSKGISSNAIRDSIERVPGACLVSTSWRCSAVAIARCRYSMMTFTQQNVNERGSYRIIAGSRESTGRVACQVKVWDVAGVEPVQLGAEVQPPPPTVQIRFSLLGHTGPVVAVAISENTQIGVTAADDFAIIVWDLVRGKERVRMQQAHTKPIRSLRISHEGKWGITGAYDRNVKLWDLFKGKCIGVGQGGAEGRKNQDEHGHLECVMGCDLLVSMFPGDKKPGGWGCSGSFDGSVKLWDLTGMRVVCTMKGHKGHVWDTRLSRSLQAETLVSCGSDAAVRVWAVPHGELLMVLEGHSKEAISLSMRLDGIMAATASFDMSLKVWDLRRGECRRTMTISADRPSCCSISQDGLVLVASSEDDSIGMVVTMELIKVLVKLPSEGKKEVVLELSVDPDDGFDVLCDQLERKLRDRELVPASNLHAELPSRFHAFNRVRAARQSVALMMGGSLGDGVGQGGSSMWGMAASPMPGSASKRADDIPLAAAAGRKGLAQVSTLFLNGLAQGASLSAAAGSVPTAVGGAKREAPIVGGGGQGAEQEDRGGNVLDLKKQAVPMFSFETHKMMSVRKLGIHDGTVLQLLKPIDPFEVLGLDEIKELGEKLRGNLWWERQEKQAALLLKEYATMKEALRNQRRNEKAVKEVHFAHKDVGTSSAVPVPGIFLLVGKGGAGSAGRQSAK